MQERKESVARRTVLGAAATGGVLAAATTLVPTRTPDAAIADEPKVKQDSAQGYRLTEHVQRYYQTARV